MPNYSELLRCTPETVREKTPHIIPGAKFGRDWVYSRDLIVKAVERESMVVRCMPSGPPNQSFGVFTKGKPPSLST